MHVPFDIIYNVFFFVDDYETAQNFWLLSKDFNSQYMNRYVVTYRHKYRILHNLLFNFLSLLPDTKLLDDDVEMFWNINAVGLDEYAKRTIRHDTRFMYYMYREFVMRQLRITHSNRDMILRAQEALTDMCMIQGPHFIDRLCNVQFVKNNVRLVATSHVGYKQKLLDMLKPTTFRHLTHQLAVLERLLV